MSSESNGDLVPEDKSIKSGLGSNYLAMAVVGVSGLIINLVVARGFGAGGLGVFSQTYLVFVLAAQPAVGGIHYAVLRATARSDPGIAVRVVREGMVAVVPMSAMVSVVVVGLAVPISRLVDSPDLGMAVALAAPGLTFHAMNKVLMAYVNGLRRMSTFAALQGSRVLLLAGSVSVITLLTEDARWLGVSLTVSEFALFLAIAISERHVWGRFPSESRRAAALRRRELRSFGLQSVGSGLVQELNARVDLLVLAVLLSDEMVGIYTLAATLLEGALQFLIVLRNNINPVLAQLLEGGRVMEVEELARQFRIWIVGLSSLSWLAVALLFKPVIGWLGLSPDFHLAWPALLILLGGLVLAAPLLPFDQIFLLAGRPSLQTGVMTAVVVGNLGLNFLLVPWLNIEGAAISTAVSFVMLGIAIWVFGRRSFGVRLL